MLHTAIYPSPIGPLILVCDEEGLTGVWFHDGRYLPTGLPEPSAPDVPFLADTVRWLDCYFSGREPDFMPALHLTGSPFRQLIGHIMLKIPYGCTRTYGDIACEAAARLNKTRMSAQAVGGAVGHNPISIIIPCHRVIGTGGNLTGYGGGINKKVRLLELEHADMRGMFLPKTQ